MSSKTVTAIPNVRIGTPMNKPPLSAYAHLSHKDRMVQGYPHFGMDPQLIADRSRAHKIIQQYNTTTSEDQAKRSDLLHELFHSSCNEKSVFVEPPFRADYGFNIKIGNNFYANFNCVILDSAPVDIGDDCLLGPGVHIYTACHPLEPKARRALFDPDSDYYDLAFPVKIGHTCWIGGNAVICPGVSIGDNVVIGAGAVVTKDVPNNVVVGGNPARIIRYLDGAELPTNLKQ